MFEGIRSMFTGRSGKRQMVTSLHHITDHPKIGINPAEYQRIAQSIELYAGRYPGVAFLNAYGEERTRAYFHLNMLQVVGNRMAKVIFNEKCKIHITNAQAQAFLDEVFQQNDFYKNFERYLESCIALGGLAIRPYVADGKIKLAWCQANTFYPLRSNTNEVSEAAIVTKSQQSLKGKTIYYTLFEFHEWEDQSTYRITNELYWSDSPEYVGKRTPLGEKYEELQESVTFEHLSRPLFVYLKPAGMNNLDLLSPLGLGICDNARPTLKQINDTYDEYHHEIQTARRKVIVSDHFIRTRYDEINGQAPRMLEDQNDIFVAFPGGMDEMFQKELSFDIRAKQFIDSINHFIRTLEMQIGLSSGTFSFGKNGLRTATEIVSENSMTYQTRNSYVTVADQAIKELITSICELGMVSGVYHGRSAFDVEIDFDDGVFVDKSKQLDYYGKASTYQFIPRIEAIQRVFDVPRETAEEWVSQMEQEQQEEALSSEESMLMREDTEERSSRRQSRELEEEDDTP